MRNLTGSQCNRFRIGNLCDKLSLSQHLTALKCHILTMKIILMLYILTLLCNTRSFNALINIKSEYAVLAFTDPV